MIQILDSTDRTLILKQVSNGGDLQYTAAWADVTDSNLTEGSSDGVGRSSADVTIVDSPPSGARRIIKSITVHNTNASAITVIIVFKKGLNPDRIIVRTTLDPNATWYSENPTAMSGTGITDGTKGDIVVSDSGSIWTVNDNAISYSKMQDVSTGSRILGRKTSSGDPEECTISEVLDFIGPAAQGDILYRGSEGWSKLSAGTSGTFLQTRGSNANPTWRNVVTYKNILINGDMSVSQRISTVNTSVSNDEYAVDRWYALTQTAAIQVQQQSNQENEIPFNSRLTQNQPTGQRMGYAQIIEGSNCKHLRGKEVTLSFRLRSSSSQSIRYAILEWTGTEDTVTSNVVNTWSNDTYTTGNFFISSGLSIPTSGIGGMTPSAATWEYATPLTVTLGTLFNNLIVFIWSEKIVSQNVTLDISNVQLEVGSVATDFEFMPNSITSILCERYAQMYSGEYGNVNGLGNGWINGTIGSTSNSAIVQMYLPTTMRIDSVAITISNPAHFALGGPVGRQLTNLVLPPPAACTNRLIQLSATISGVAVAVGQPGQFRFDNSLGRLFLDAEL